MDSEKSKLVQALEKRGRYTKIVDMANVLGHDLVDHDGSPLTKVCYRINVKSDEDDALVAAYARVSRLAERAEGGREQIKSDNDLLDDAKNVQAIWRACRRPENPDLPLFVAPQWMHENLDTDVIAGLINGYNEVRIHKIGLPITIDSAFAIQIRESCTVADDDDIPQRALNAFVREVLSRTLIVTAKVWTAERKATRELVQSILDSLSGDLDEREKKILIDACKGFLALHDQS